MNASDVTKAPLDFFLHSLLPQVSHHVREVQQLLSAEGKIVQGCWKQFMEWEYTDEQTRNLLKDFIEIFGDVATLSKPVVGGTSTVNFTLSKATATACSSPSAALQLANANVALPPCFTTAVPWLLGAKPGFASDGLGHDISLSCRRILREDARRRFTFGITADDDSLRIWFFSRCHEFATPRFSFITDARNIVHLFLSLAFASPEELGYDTSMSCVIDDGACLQYRLTLNGISYVTKKTLSDNRVGVSCGRATRVWEAFRDDDPEHTPVVIKDLWPLADAVPEGEQLLDLHQQLQVLSNPDTPRPPGQYFLTVLAHGFVKTSAGTDDSTTAVLRGGLLPPQIYSSRPRKHYRIVFKEVGTAVESLKALPEIMRALSDATYALRLLHRLGFVHRDVSAGNILLVDGVGKLSDLEYMQSFHSRQPVEFWEWRTVGTPEYTSAEVASGGYSFHGFTRNLEALDEEDLIPTPPFWFNPLHDLESVMWIAIFSMSYLFRHTTPRMKKVLDAYFPRSFSDHTIAVRTLAIRSNILRLPTSDPLSPISKTLDIVRAQILINHGAFAQDFDERYFALEDPAVATETTFGQLHPMIASVYERAAVESRGIRPSSPQCLPPTEKRKASNDSQPPTVELSSSPLPQRPSKRAKSISPTNTSPPTTRSSGSHRRRALNVAPRRSSRIAGKAKNKSESP